MYMTLCFFGGPGSIVVLANNLRSLSHQKFTKDIGLLLEDTWLNIGI